MDFYFLVAAIVDGYRHRCSLLLGPPARMLLETVGRRWASNKGLAGSRKFSKTSGLVLGLAYTLHMKTRVRFRSSSYWYDMHLPKVPWYGDLRVSRSPPGGAPARLVPSGQVIPALAPCMNMWLGRIIVTNKAQARLLMRQFQKMSAR